MAKRVGTPVYACEGWWPNRIAPKLPEMLVDVVFPRASESGPVDRTTLSDRAVATALGAQIVHLFHANAVRMRIATHDIPRLHRQLGVVILSVPDPRRYDLEVAVLYKPDARISPNEEAKFVALGGRITHRLTTITASRVSFRMLGSPHCAAIPALG